MNSLLIALAIAVTVAFVAIVIRRSQVSDVPTQKIFAAPTQIDRADFAMQSQDWLVVVFTSASCHVCADMSAKAKVLATREVAVIEVEYESQRELHERYKIEAVPTIVMCDPQGVVRKSFMGPLSATDLWAAMATARQPETSACEAEASAGDTVDPD
ncbi:MAG: thioredoxin family protein [Actinomycetes bacterium]